MGQSTDIEMVMIPKQEYARLKAVEYNRQVLDANYRALWAILRVVGLAVKVPDIVMMEFSPEDCFIETNYDYVIATTSYRAVQRFQRMLPEATNG